MHGSPHRPRIYSKTLKQLSFSLWPTTDANQMYACRSLKGEGRTAEGSPGRGHRASARRAWPRASCATVAVIPEHGSWSGTVWSSVSSSQRILSLWLERLSTDRIARQSREAPSPLVVFGKRGNLDLLVAVDAAAEQRGLRTGLALAQADRKSTRLNSSP